MIIRHDLELVFIHIPKCGGKEIRKVIKAGIKNDNDCIELFNFEYDKRTRKYVDLAHLAAYNVRLRKEYRYIKKYQTLCCTRNPYARYISAVNEYYRQESKSTEKLVEMGKITKEMRLNYYKDISYKHSIEDPRFVHSWPMHYFTELGKKNLVNKIIRCESLKEDLTKLLERKGAPNIMIEKAQALRNSHEKNIVEKLDEDEVIRANNIYKLDFGKFGYEMKKIKRCDKFEEKFPNYIHLRPTINWHWGPSASINQDVKQGGN